MPEGPELNKAARFVNTVCKGRIFHGKILKSAVNHKNPDITHNFKDYTIQAESRGKEMALILSPLQPEEKKNGKKLNEAEKTLRILFRFGMSGKFQFTTQSEKHKHAHLSFFTNEKPVMVLSFVDVRRFGRWEVNDGWSPNRGPDPILEYAAFRDNILNNLENNDFKKPLCEVMHNQKYFNGIGNYLRAEIIYRTGIPPFTLARDTFSNLKIKKEFEETKLSSNADILQLCNKVPSEVLQLPGAGYDPSGKHSDYSAFMEWLQCYSNPDMSNLVDHDGRTMWFKGPAGPLAPKGGKSRSKPRQGKRARQDNESEIKKEEVVHPKKRKPVRHAKEDKKGKTKKQVAADSTQNPSRKRKTVMKKETASPKPTTHKKNTKMATIGNLRRSSRNVQKKKNVV